MKYFLIYCLMIFTYQLSISQDCDTYYESVLDKEDSLSKMFYSYKKMPRYIRTIFEKQIRKEKIDFTNYSHSHKYNFSSKNKRLIFLYCYVKSNDIIISVYDREGLASSGFNYFFTINENNEVIKSCTIRLIEMVCDPKRLSLIVKNKDHHLKVNEKVLNKMNEN